MSKDTNETNIETKNEEKKSSSKPKRNGSIVKRIKIIFTIVVLAVFLIGVVLICNNNNKESKKEIITVSTLKKIIKVSDLSTYEAVYNGIAKVYSKEDDNGKSQLKYHVSYKSRIKAGIDFEKVNVSVDSDNKKVVVKLPKIKINEVNVDIASLDYIFVDKKANNSTVSQEAYKACIVDAEEESEENEAIYDLAKENANNIVEALVRPFIEEIDKEFELEIK